MLRLLVANRVVSIVATVNTAGRNLRENRYEITDLGVLDWTAARKFYLNLAPPSDDLDPLVTDMGQFAPYDEKTRARLTKAAFVKQLTPLLHAIAENTVTSPQNSPAAPAPRSP